jgi:hypothetical protein
MAARSRAAIHWDSLSEKCINVGQNLNDYAVKVNGKGANSKKRGATEVTES